MKKSSRDRMTDAQILSALPAFAAAARLGSFTRAARELGLTQSGLSRRVAALEQGLGVTLFSRRGRSISITNDGKFLAGAANDALHLIERTRQSLGGIVAGSVRVGALQSIGGLWLAPKLPGFLEAQPGVTVTVAMIDADFSDAHKDPVNWDPSVFDVVLTWGRGSWRSLVVNLLAKERMVPVCSPQFAERHTIDPNSIIWDVPRLVHTSRADAWRGYAEATNVAPPRDNSLARLEFEHFFMVLEAVRANAGVALVPDLFVDADLRSGRLVAPWPSWTTGAIYAAVASPAALARPAVASFVEWLLEQTMV